MNLAEMQALMLEAMRWPTGVEAFLAQASPEVRTRFESVFAQTAAFDRTSRVQVYAEAYFWRLAEVVRDQFPVTAWLAGPKRFHNFLTDFVLAHPSDSPDLRRYGAAVPAALRDHPLGTTRRSLGGVADIEWAIISAVDAADETAIDAGALGAIPLDRWPALVLDPVATLSLVACELDFGQLHQTHAAEKPAPAHPAKTPGQTFVVWRAPNLDVYHRRLDATEAAVLEQLCEGHSFGTLCESAATSASIDPPTVVAWLQRWLGDGMLRAAR